MIVNGWFDFATRRPGPSWKQNGGVNTFDLFIAHSAVGFEGGFWGEMEGTARKSVQLFNRYDGALFQLYPVTTQCWASGNSTMNNRGVAMECEGGWSPFNEPLRPAQTATVIRVLKDIAAAKGVSQDTYWRGPFDGSDKNATLYEHQQGTRFGGAPTACPSGRYPWEEIMAGLVTPVPTPRDFIWGDEQHGLERRGLQVFAWSNWDDGDALGNYEGSNPKAHYRRLGDGSWVLL